MNALEPIMLKNLPIYSFIILLLFYWVSNNNVYCKMFIKLLGNGAADVQRIRSPFYFVNDYFDHYADECLIIIHSHKYPIRIILTKIAIYYSQNYGSTLGRAYYVVSYRIVYVTVPHHCITVFRPILAPLISY